jgi:hypothetical protein
MKTMWLITKSLCVAMAFVIFIPLLGWAIPVYILIKGVQEKCTPEAEAVSGVASKSERNTV